MIHDFCRQRPGVRSSGTPRWIGSIVLLSALGILALPTAQAQTPRGGLRGEVQDATGGRIAAARVVAKSAGSGIESGAVSNACGDFRIDGLLRGAYQLAVSASGFNKATTTVEVAISTTQAVAVVLSPSGA